MTHFVGRTILLTTKAVLCLAGGLLFGLLPILTVIAWKIVKGGTVATWKVTTWTLGMLRSA